MPQLKDFLGALVKGVFVIQGWVMEQTVLVSTHLEGNFSELSNCSDLDTSCPSHCSCHLDDLETGLYIDCPGLNMSVFPSRVPKCDGHSVQYYLNISGNLVSSLRDDIQYIDKVVSLDVSNNEISKLFPSFFYRAKYSVFRALYLHNNNLRSLPENMRQVLEKDRPTVTLWGNPWHCGCHMYWLYQFTINANVSGDHEITCKSPRDFTNQSLSYFMEHAQCDANTAYSGLPDYAVALICISVGYVAIASLIAFFYTIRRRVKVGGCNKAV